MQERKGIVTLKGNPMTLLGPSLGPGDRAPAFTVVDGGLAPVSLAESSSVSSRASTPRSASSRPSDFTRRRPSFPRKWPS